MIWLVNFPIPPSVNEYLMPVVSNKYGTDKRGKQFQRAHFVKTKPHADYLKACHLWRAYHNTSFSKSQDHLLRAQLDARTRRIQFALRVDQYFAFEHSRLWTVNNLPQQLDADNRLKPCRDALASLLGIDDKFFFAGYFEKVTCASPEAEGCFIRITQMTPRTAEDIMTVVKLEAGK